MKKFRIVYGGLLALVLLAGIVGISAISPQSAQTAESLELIEQFPIVPDLLGEPQAGIDSDRIRRDPGQFRSFDGRPEFRQDLVYEIVINCFAVAGHFVESAPGMHQDQPCPGLRHRREKIGVEPSSGHIVDDRRADRQTPARNFGLDGVHRHRDVRVYAP